jgi:hypothetical protein
VRQQAALALDDVAVQVQEAVDVSTANPDTWGLLPSHIAAQERLLRSGHAARPRE